MVDAIKSGSKGLASGAQTVERACVLLQEIARAGGDGARILDLCGTTGLSRPTAHRILLTLAASGFVRQDGRTRRYGLGSKLFELGLAAPSPVRAFPDVTREVDELAAVSQDTAYLMMRSQDEVVCAWRGVGAYPIRANIVSAGDRRPMASSAAGLCILAAMPPDEAERILQGSRDRLPGKCRLSIGELRAQIGFARKNRHSFGEGLVMEGVTGVGMVVPSRAVTPYLAISVSAISSRIPPQRVPTLLAMLAQTARRIGTLVDSSGPSAPRDEPDRRGRW